MKSAERALGAAGPPPNGGNGVIRGTTRRRHAANQLLILQNPHRSQPRAPRRLQDLGAGPIGAKKTRPAQPLQRLFREKVRPAHQKTPILSHCERTGRTFSRTRRNNIATLKPTTPLLTLNKGPPKPTTPLRPKTAPKTPISHPQRRRRFQSRLGRRPQRRRRFQTTAHLADRARLRSPWATAGIGQATSGRPMLQTSSNQRDSNHLARTSVTNVVNLSPKTAIFSEKALRLTTFVTTRQKATRKTPWIDDVCNNTHQSSPKTQHASPPVTPPGSRGTRLRCP